MAASTEEEVSRFEVTVISAVLIFSCAFKLPIKKVRRLQPCLLSQTYMERTT